MYIMYEPASLVKKLLNGLKFKHVYNELHKMEGLLVRMEACLSESEMMVRFLRDEVKGKSMVINLTNKKEGKK